MIPEKSDWPMHDFSYEICSKTPVEIRLKVRNAFEDLWIKMNHQTNGITIGLLRRIK